MRACLIVLNAFSCPPVQSDCSASGPLVASYRDLAISSNPGFQILQNPAMPKKVQRCFFVFRMLRPNIACFLSGDKCLLLPGFIIYPRYLTCCFEICAFLGDTVALGPKEIKDFNGILI